MLEWCVPVCDSAFRQALAGERWLRRLVELARRVAQRSLGPHGGSTVGARDGEPADRQLEFVVRPWLRSGRRDARARGLRAARDATETPRVMVSPDSNAGPLILGGLQNSLADTFAKESTESEEHVKQEMAVMRDDLELLRHAVQARKAGKLEVSEHAEARQAANDCSGWLHQPRRAARLVRRGPDGPHAPRLEQPGATARHGASLFSRSRCPRATKASSRARPTKRPWAPELRALE